MSARNLIVAGAVGASLGGAIWIQAGSDSNGDGILEFVDGEVITADDINTNFSRTAQHIVTYEGAIEIASEGNVGLGGSPQDDETLHLFQDESGVGDHLNLRLEKAEGEDMLQLSDGQDFELNLGINADDDYGYLGETGYPEALVIRDGQLGLGTADPSAQLDIVGSASTPLELARFRNAGANDQGYVFFPRPSDTTRGLMIGHQATGTGAGNNAGWIRASGGLSQNVEIQSGLDGSSVRGFVHLNPGGGNVGIGTSSPIATLDVNGSINANNHTSHAVWYNMATASQGPWVPGYMKLITPIGYREGNMFSLKIKGYRYGIGGTPVEIRCGGYAYENSGLISSDCHTEGTGDPVGIGVENDLVIVTIGSGSGTWYYDHFTVEYVGWYAKRAEDFSWNFVYNTAPSTVNTNNVYTDDSAGKLYTTGAVGVGTFSPQADLDVNGTIRAKDLCDENGSNCKDISAGWGSSSSQWTTSSSDIYYNSGAVGIGTSSPSGLLTLSGSGASLYIKGTDVSNQNIWLQSQGSNTFAIEAQSASGGSGSYLSNRINGGGMFFRTTTSGGSLNTNLFIGGSGAVGIGTTSPSGLLTLSGSGPSMHVQGSDTANQNIWFQSQGSHTFGIEAQSASGGGGSYLSNRVNSGGIFFRTTTSGGSLNTNLFIGGNGTVGIGTTSPGYTLHVNGSIGATSYTTISDARLKMDVTPIDDALTGIRCLQGVSYVWKDPTLSQDRQIGLLAQDVEACFPEAVTETDAGIKGVLYSQLVAPLIEAVKELASLLGSQQEQLDVNSRENKALEGELEQQRHENATQSHKLQMLEKLTALQQQQIDLLQQKSLRDQQKILTLEKDSRALEHRISGVERQAKR